MSGRRGGRPDLRSLVRHPAWLPERVRGVLRRRRERTVDRAGAFRAYAPYASTELEILSEVAGVDEARYAALCDELWLPEPEAGDGSEWDPRVPLLRLMGLLVAATGPERVVETGVERGYSSAVILRGLEVAGRGTLHSIDLPRADWAPGSEVGTSVPAALRDRWDLRLGPSRRLLPRLLGELGEIDLFLHDADHSPPAQLEELTVVWPPLRAGGVLVCDDVASPSLLNFALTHGVSPRVIVRERWGDVIGVLVKP